MSAISDSSSMEKNTSEKHCRHKSEAVSSYTETDFDFAPNSGRVLDLPHALGEAFDANAASVLHLVSHERDDVLGREVASGEERSITFGSMLLRKRCDQSAAACTYI